MAQHYSIKHFFRKIPNALLARYFLAKDILIDFDFTAIKETHTQKLFDAWLELPDDKRKPMDTEFAAIYAMSCEKGFIAIRDEARWKLRGQDVGLEAFIKIMSVQKNHHHRAMLTFLDYADFWDGATRFYHADTLSYWRKRTNMKHHPARTDQLSLKNLADLIREYFYRVEGRGKNCTVEAYRRGKLDYFFAYPEDFSQQSPEWEDGQFTNRPHNPAFEIVFVYSQEEGSLDLNFRGAKKLVLPLQKMFSIAILDDADIVDSPKDERVYDLNRMREPDFNFVYDGCSGIESVAIKLMRLSSSITQGDRITLECDSSSDRRAICKKLHVLRKSIDLNHYAVTQVGIKAVLYVEGNKPAKAINFRLTYPNSCSLKYDGVDLKLREMLSASGIELKSMVETECV
jgi:hypothetical protein